MRCYEKAIRHYGSDKGGQTSTDYDIALVSQDPWAVRQTPADLAVRHWGKQLPLRFPILEQEVLNMTTE